MPVVQKSAFADESTATESEAGETRTLVRHMEKCSAPKNFRRLILAGVAVGVLAVALVTLLVTAGSAEHGAMPAAAALEVSSIDKVVSKAVVVLPANESGMGCSNWEEIRTALFHDLPTAEKCMEACQDWAGCTGFGFQPDACDGDQQITKGACYIWAGACDLEANDCWNNYEMPEANVKPVPWALNASKYGCSNWDTAKIAEPTTEWSENACGIRCSSTPGCIGWNYQPEECPTIQGIKAGACYLWKEICEKEENPCWNLFDEVLL